MNDGLLMAFVMLTSGLGAIALAGLMVWWRFRQRRSWYSTTGEVIGTVARHKGLLAPVILFQGPDGDTRTWAGDRSYIHAEEMVGTEIRIHVDQHGRGKVHLPKPVDPFVFAVAGLAR